MESQDHTELRHKLFLLPCIFNQSFVYLDKHVNGDLSFKICLDKLYIPTAISPSPTENVENTKRSNLQRDQIYIKDE
jgi:hypothetical protein